MTNQIDGIYLAARGVSVLADNKIVQQTVDNSNQNHNHNQCQGIPKAYLFFAFVAMVFVHSKTSFGIAVIFLAATLSSLVKATEDNGDCAPRCQAQIKAANEKFGVKDVMDVSELKETVKNSVTASICAGL